MGRKNRNKKERREERLAKKQKKEEEKNKPKTQEERKQETDKLVEQLTNLGLGTTIGMDSLLIKMRNYVDTGESWIGKAFIEEHKKYLHINLTNLKSQYCGIRISDDP